MSDRHLLLSLFLQSQYDHFAQLLAQPQHQQRMCGGEIGNQRVRYELIDVFVITADYIGFPEYKCVEDSHKNKRVGGFGHGRNVGEFGFDQVDVVTV